MEDAIFDTSVWIDFSKNISSPETELLEKYLQNHSDNLYLTPTILQEFLMGLKSEKEFEFYKKNLTELHLFSSNWAEISIEAAKLNFDLKKKGITIRKSNDCLIAAVAIKQDALLVHNDIDFERIAAGSPLRTLKTNV
jgi:predicted nucleic acid-binding protein